MKRIITFLCVAVLSLATVITAQAADTRLSVKPMEQVALFVQLDPNNVGKPVESTEKIFKKVAEKLQEVDKTVVPYAKAQKDLKVYIRDNDTSPNQRELDKGVLLRTKDLRALADIENVRYVVTVSTRVTSSEVKANIWTGQRKNLTILTNVVIFDAANGEYLMDEEYQSIGKTSGSYDRAFHRAIEEVLKQIKFQDYFK